jgi:predicted phage-related endonuclease
MKPVVLDLEQGSDAWKAARCGSLGGSRFHEAIAKTKTGWGASRANLAAELVIERLTGQPVEKFVTAAMQAGTENEPAARALYEFLNDCTVVQVGLYKHPTIQFSHYSPDGLIDEDGILEIKAPQPAAHLQTLLTEEIPGKYVTQMMWGMAVTGRKWCDYVSYSPAFPSDMQLFVKRVHRDESAIAELQKEAAVFLAEVEATLAKLTSKFKLAEAAE